MKTYIKLAVIFIFIFSLNSCLIFPNSKKGFNVYKDPIKNKCIEGKVLTTGVYAPTSSAKGVLFYFYNDGKVKVIGWTSDFFDDAENILHEFNLDHQFNSKENWGHYSINCDTLTIQGFNRNNMEFFKRQVIERKCQIINDSSLKLVSSINSLINYQFVNEPITYYFYPTSKKPDSTKAWFNNKRWYKNNLHESRK